MFKSSLPDHSKIYLAHLNLRHLTVDKIVYGRALHYDLLVRLAQAKEAHVGIHFFRDTRSNSKLLRRPRRNRLLGFDA